MSGVAGGDDRAASAVDIANLVYGYAERIDLGDFDGVAELFAAATYRAVAGDGIAVFDGPKVGRLLRSMVITGADGTPGTKHVTTNLIIDVDDQAATATCRSYYTVLQAGPDRTIRPIVAGRYHDRFERVGDQWRFADRLIFSDLVGDVSLHLRESPY